MKAERARGFAGGWARAIRRGRWIIAIAWVAAAVLAVVELPTIQQAASGAVGALIPKDADAVKAEIASKTEFGFPLISRTVIVERAARGLSARRQADAVSLAGRLTRGRVPGFGFVKGAIPVSNLLGAPPFSREHGTTVLTYLFIDPNVNTQDRTSVADRLVHRLVPTPPGGFVGTTGQAAARTKQASIIEHRLPLMELATVALVLLAVGLRFRAVGAPLVTLAAIAVAYLVASRSVAWIGQRAGLAVPQEVEPVMVVLIFGVVTDYAVFFLSRCRSLLAEGVAPRDAAERSSAELTPIVATAGVTVAAAAASLLVARLGFFRVFGPGLALAVMVSLIVALTLVPALLAIFGRSVFWPRRLELEAPGEDGAETPAGNADRRRRSRSRAVRAATEHPALTVAASLLLLGATGSGLAHIHLSNPVIRGLPADAEARVAYEQASAGFAPGVLAPTVAVVSQPGIRGQRTRLARLQALLAREPGVDLVLGPADQRVAGLRLGATISRTTSAVRYFIVLAKDPLGAGAITDLRRIEDRLPGLLVAAGLPRAHVALAGDTALSAETIDKTVADLKRITPVALGAIFLMLAIFLRALVAPLYLVATSLIAFVMSLGLTTYLFQDLLGFEGITYYVVFVVAVLLVSLGSDYNVFLVGRIWQEARRRTLREAVPIAASAASHSITLAGVVLAGSFALLATVPVRSFYEIAFAMTAGLLIDAFLVRTMMLPAVIMLVGERSGWPGRRLRGPAHEAGAVASAR